MKVLVLLVVISYCHSAVIITPRNPDDVGAAVTFNNQDNLGAYDFGYSEGHPSGASFRRESGDAYGNKVGSFGLRDADGRLRIVRYVADANGFRADITSNEPGVASADPASASYNKPAVVPAPVVPVAPAVPIAPVVAAPPPPPPPVRVYGPPPAVRPVPPPPQYNFVVPQPAAVAYPPPPPPPPPAATYYNFPPPPPPKIAAPVIAAPAPVFPPPAPLFAPPARVFAAPPARVFAAPPAPIFAPAAPVLAPAAPVVKSFATFGPDPPPPAPYYSNVVQGKGYVADIRNFPNFIPSYAPAPARFEYLPPPKQTLQTFGYPL